PLSVSPAPLRFYCPGHHRHLHSFPTRRSSDLKFVQLTPPEDEPATGQLSDGDVIATSNSRTATDIEQVLGALSLLLNGGGVDQLQPIVAELRTVTDGREEELTQTLRSADELIG